MTVAVSLSVFGLVVRSGEVTGEQVVWLVVAQHGTVQPASIPQCSIGRQAQYAGTVVTQYTVHSSRLSAAD